MKNQELFDKTVGILVRAYLNDKLNHDEACGCAVGNLVASSNDYRIVFSKNGMIYGGDLVFVDKYNMTIQPHWCTVHSYGSMNNPANNSESARTLGKQQLESTGYSIDETCKIEEAFEKVNRVTDKDGYLGLMKVVDILAKIHQLNIDETNHTKSLFKKELAEVG